MKAGFWLRGAQGKINDSVLRKHKGYTVQAEFKAPSNPQTSLQMATRILFATIAQARAAMRPIVDHSFEKFKSKEDNLSYFFKRNLARLRAGAAIDFEEIPDPADSNVFTTTKGVSVPVPNIYLMSEGSAIYSGACHFVNDNESGLDYTLGDECVYMASGTGTEGQYKIKPAEIFALCFGLRTSADQLTMCLITNPSGTYVYSYMNDDSPAFQIPASKFEYGRLVLKNTIDSNPEEVWAVSSGNTGLITILKKYIDFRKSSEDLYFALIENLQCETSQEDFGMTFTIDDTVQANFPRTLAGCFIFSRLVDGRWTRSTSSMVIGTPKFNDDAGLNFGLNYNSCINAWFEDRQIAESDAFLSQGGSNSSNFQ